MTKCQGVTRGLPVVALALGLLGPLPSCQRAGSGPGDPPSTDDPEPPGTAGAGGRGGSSAGAAGSTGAGGAGGAAGSAGATGGGGAPAGADASAGTGGARDSGSSAADVAAASGTGCQGVQICDDFEAYAVGAAPGGVWRTLVSSARVAVDGTRSFSGGKSVLVTVEPTGSGARGLLRLVKPPLPVANNNLYGRMMFWVNAVPTSRIHWFNVWATGRLESGATATYAIGGLGTSFILNYFPGDCWRNSVRFPTGRWACLQWQFDGSKNPDGTQKNEMRAWLDGVSIGTAVKTGSGCVMAPARTEWVAPPFEDLRLGWERAAGNQIQMWMDDIAVDGKPIPCLPPKP